MAKKRVTITHVPTGEVIADGPVGWGVTPFEGNWYISRRYLKTDGFQTSAVPGLCFYKFVYLWTHFRARDGSVSKYLGWKYVIPNPVFPFIAFRVAVPARHPELDVVVAEDPA
jgi:uncharacterized protein (DUF427 family)